MFLGRFPAMKSGLRDQPASSFFFGLAGTLIPWAEEWAERNLKLTSPSLPGSGVCTRPVGNSVVSPRMESWREELVCA